MENFILTKDHPVSQVCSDTSADIINQLIDIKKEKEWSDEFFINIAMNIFSLSLLRVVGMCKSKEMRDMLIRTTYRCLIENLKKLNQMKAQEERNNQSKKIKEDV